MAWGGAAARIMGLINLATSCWASCHTSSLLFPFSHGAAVAWLPDCSVLESRRFFYPRLISSVPSISAFLDMPDINEANTKRYESAWLRYMRSLDLGSYSCLIAHGTSAEALLRYLESDVLVGGCILIDPTDLYTAGERHGRRFHHSLIASNCPLISCLSTSGADADKNAVAALEQALRTAKQTAATSFTETRLLQDRVLQELKSCVDPEYNKDE